VANTTASEISAIQHTSRLAVLRMIGKPPQD
jgi:hypothetical protein